MKTSLLFTLLDIKVQFNRLFLLFVILFIIFGILKILWPWPFKSIKKVEEENTKENEEIGKKIELFAEEIKYSSLENLFPNTRNHYGYDIEHIKVIVKAKCSTIFDILVLYNMNFSSKETNDFIENKTKELFNDIIKNANWDNIIEIKLLNQKFHAFEYFSPVRQLFIARLELVLDELVEKRFAYLKYNETEFFTKKGKDFLIEAYENLFYLCNKNHPYRSQITARINHFYSFVSETE